MKRINPITALVGTLMAMILVAGCATTPRGLYSNTQDAYITVLQVAISAKVEGDISDEAWVENYLPYINRGDALLDLADMGTKNGADIGAYLSELTLITSSLTRLIEGDLE